MSDEHTKLVAKIQHFYDIMIRRIEQDDDARFFGVVDKKNVGLQEKAIEMRYLIDEYSKIFDSFIYK